MAVLQVQLFGGNQLIRHNRSLVTLQPVVKEFLAYLLLNRHRHFCRPTLAGLFWGGADEKKARRCLSTALWRLRKELEPDGLSQATFVITYESGEIGFNCQSSYWLDVATFEENANIGLSCPPGDTGAEEVQALEKAVHLYTGDLLEGIYSDWVLGRREQLRSQYLKCLIQLMRYHRAQEDYDQALTFGEKILRFDPLREEIHREMMRLYVQKGDRALAIRQYEFCRQTLAQEMDIPPMTETQELYHRLLAEHPKPSTSSRIGRPANLQQALHQLDQAMLGLEEARGQMRQAMRIVHQSVEP